MRLRIWWTSSSTISPSRNSSGRGRASTIATFTPNVENIAAYSMPITPQPMTTIERGSSASLRTSSLVMTQPVSPLSEATFAGRTGNWPLAEYYVGSLQGHMQLVADKSAQAKPADVVAKADQQVAENSPTAGIQRAIQRKDVVQFQAAYRAMLQSCYNCHKAVGKPYLRPRMPVKPAQAIINSDPTATWPE